MLNVAMDVKLSFLHWLCTEDDERQKNIMQYREYYDGQHDAQLSDRQRRYLELKTGQEFNGNYCPIPVDSLAEKLTVTGCDAGDVQTPTLDDWLTANKLDGLQGIVHTGSLRDGDGYVMVSWDDLNKRPVFTPEMACCNGAGVKVHYSEENYQEVSFATKRWRVTQGHHAGYVRRLNIYYPDRIEKYISNQEYDEGQWAAYEEPGQPWPIPWVRRDGSPMGVPIIHFRNKEQGYDYGTSELSDVIPLQNAFNKSLIDLLAAGDTTAFRVYTMVGDNPTGIKVSPGSWIYTTRPPGGDSGAAIGFIPGEDLTPLIQLKDSMAMEIARITRTPLSYFQISGQVASDATLKEQEQPLVSKAKKRQIYFGNSWENVLRMARALQNTFGSGAPLDENQPIEVIWASPEVRNVKEDLEAATMKQALGVPKEQLWREMGYTADQIEEFKQTIEAEQIQQGNVGDMLLRSFERGATQ